MFGGGDDGGDGWSDVEGTLAKFAADDAANDLRIMGSFRFKGPQTFTPPDDAVLLLVWMMVPLPPG